MCDMTRLWNVAQSHLCKLHIRISRGRCLREFGWRYPTPSTERQNFFRCADVATADDEASSPVEGGREPLMAASLEPETLRQAQTQGHRHGVVSTVLRRFSACSLELGGIDSEFANEFGKRSPSFCAGEAWNCLQRQAVSG